MNKLMKSPEYTLVKLGFKWYIVQDFSTCNNIQVPENCLSFYFKSNAERVMQQLNWAVSIGKDWQWQYDYECNRRNNEN